MMSLNHVRGTKWEELPAMGGYWRGTMSKRLNRRRAIAATGGFTVGAALLAACGGSSDAPKSDGPAVSKLVTPPQDTSKQAKRGGTMNDSKTADINDWDVNITSSAQLSLLAPFGYS